MKQLALLFLIPLFSIGCQVAASANDPSGNGTTVTSNPDRPIGSGSVSVISPDGSGAVAGTPNSTTHPSPQP
jgi:hypothetical protein